MKDCQFLEKELIGRTVCSYWDKLCSVLWNARAAVELRLPWGTMWWALWNTSQEQQVSSGTIDSKRDLSPGVFIYGGRNYSHGEFSRKLLFPSFLMSFHQCEHYNAIVWQNPSSHQLSPWLQACRQPAWSPQWGTLLLVKANPTAKIPSTKFHTLHLPPFSLLLFIPKSDFH